VFRGLTSDVVESGFQPWCLFQLTVVDYRPFFSDRLPEPDVTRYLRFMRKVVKLDKQPFEVKPQTQSVWICMCGLSKNQPFCDGSHKTTRDEEDGKTYEYDSEGHRREV
jgi:CDGSH-type Zn-finger protein